MIMDCVVLLISILTDVRTLCSERFYNDSGKCVSCPVHCTFCNSSSFCFLCDNGYSGADCSQLCDRCKTGTSCAKTNGVCWERCKDGLSGQYCDKQCESRCRSCMRNDTTKCLYCDFTCEVACQEGCYSQDCQRSNCTRGCLPGYWGCSCRNKCPENIKEDDESSNGALMTSVVVLSALLFIMTGTVICLLRLLCRRRRSSDTRRVKETETGSEAYFQTSEQSNSVTVPPSAVDESSYITPVCTGADPQNQFEIINSEYIPLSATDTSENQYRQLPNEI